jgi:hypothetical protein
MLYKPVITAWFTMEFHGVIKLKYTSDEYSQQLIAAHKDIQLTFSAAFKNSH